VVDENGAACIAGASSWFGKIAINSSSMVI
jgi:N-acetyl-anhydromuramyl-L-alanine amidase AmpD